MLIQSFPAVPEQPVGRWLVQRDSILPLVSIKLPQIMKSPTLLTKALELSIHVDGTHFEMLHADTVALVVLLFGGEVPLASLYLDKGVLVRAGRVW